MYERRLLTFSLAVLLSGIVFYCCGCLPQPNGIRPESGRTPSRGKLILFLNGSSRTGLNLSFSVDGASVLDAGGTWADLSLNVRQVSSATAAGRQILLAEGDLPPGSYEKVRLLLSRAQLLKENKVIDLSVPPEGLEFDGTFKIVGSQDTVVFMNWDIDNSVTEDAAFSPIVSLRTEVHGVTSQLAYVTNTASNNVTVINRESDEVFSVIAVETAPSGVAVNSKRNRLRVYVANSGSNSVSVIDPSTNQVEQTVSITSGTRPRAIAVALAQYDKEYLVVANYNSNNIAIIDTDSYQEVGQAEVGLKPVAVLTDPPVITISTMRGLTADQVNRWRAYRNQYLNIYVANSGTNTVSVIVLNTSTAEVQKTYTLTVGWNPMAMDVDAASGKVYVANSASDTISVIDALAIMDGNTAGAVSTFANVGTGGIGIVVDPLFPRLYLLKSRPNELLFLQAPSYASSDSLKSRMAPITGVLNLGESPRFLAPDPAGKKLYVVDSSQSAVYVVDRAAQRLLKSVPVGNSPCEIGVIPY